MQVDNEIYDKYWRDSSSLLNGCKGASGTQEKSLREELKKVEKKFRDHAIGCLTDTFKEAKFPILNESLKPESSTIHIGSRHADLFNRYGFVMDGIDTEQRDQFSEAGVVLTYDTSRKNQSLILCSFTFSRGRSLEYRTTGKQPQIRLGNGGLIGHNSISAFNRKYWPTLFNVLVAGALKNEKQKEDEAKKEIRRRLKKAEFELPSDKADLRTLVSKSGLAKSIGSRAP